MVIKKGWLVLCEKCDSVLNGSREYVEGTLVNGGKCDHKNTQRYKAWVNKR